MTRLILILGCLLRAFSTAQMQHDHPNPEKLGSVSFPTSCKPATQLEFDRGVALLHSFAYKSAEESFRAVTAEDPQCAMAAWGIAMTHFHQLWDPALPAGEVVIGRQEIARAATLQKASDRERGFIQALSLIFNDVPGLPYSARAAKYEAAMHSLAADNPKDIEAQVFYALALLSNVSPTDKNHQKQKQALDVLEPLWLRFPDHPGIVHYVIHACDNQELASRGLPAARAYVKVAPAAPHALHMPSHIFTRRGLWDDSIASNLAARNAAQEQGDIGEELHAMDYLVYAYLQSGRDDEAAQEIGQLKVMKNLDMSEFKIGYAATVMPIRYMVERQQWTEAEKIADPPVSVLLQVAAAAAWARGLGFAHEGRIREARREAESLSRIEERLRTSGNEYWAREVGVMRREVLGWSFQAEQTPTTAAELLRSAADDEDGLEKPPVTPGPIIPAREQLGDLFHQQGDPTAARASFEAALLNAPGRRAALQGFAQNARSQ